MPPECAFDLYCDRLSGGRHPRGRTEGQRRGPASRNRLVSPMRELERPQHDTNAPEDRAHVAGLAPRSRPRAALDGPHDRAGADDGRLPRRPPQPDPACARRVRPGRREPVREPGPVRPGRGLRELSPGRAARRRARRPGRASTCCSHPPDEVYPAGFATTVEVAGLTRRALRRPGAAAPGTSAASRRSSRSCSTWRARRRLLRRRRTSSRRS